MNSTSSTKNFLFALLFGAFLPVSVANFATLNPNTVAKFGVALGGVQGLANMVIPKTNLQQYGWEATPENLAAVKAAGTAALSTTAMHLQLLIDNSSVDKALAAGILVRLFFVAEYLLWGHDNLIGTKREGTLSWLVLNAVVFLGLVLSPEGSFLKLFGVRFVAMIAVASGGLMAYDPASSLEKYGTKDSPIPLEFGLLVEALGGILAGSGLSTYAISSGKGVNTAVGYSFIPFTLTLIKSVFVTKNYQKANMNTAPLIAWIVMATIMIGILSF